MLRRFDMGRRLTPPPGYDATAAAEARERRERELDAEIERLAQRSLLARAGIRGYCDDERGRRIWADMAGGKPGYLLFGGPGTGKTSVAMGAAKACALEWKSVRIVSEPDMLAELRDAAVARGGEEEYQLRRLQRLDLLCIDDMGKGEVSPKMFARLFAVVDARVRAGRPTVCTSNYAPAELAARYAVSVGERDAAPMASRLATLTAVRMTGDDMRVRRNDAA